MFQVDVSVPWNTGTSTLADKLIRQKPHDANPELFSCDVDRVGGSYVRAMQCITAREEARSQFACSVAVLSGSFDIHYHWPVDC